jgi:glycosyltransferase involved in cell wall biosynthesis
MNAHVAIGFSGTVGRWAIIRSGIDTARYFPCQSDGHAVRREIGIPADALLVGCVGRFVPEKGYSVMFKALSIALQRLEPAIAGRVHFLAAGNGVAADNYPFARLVERSGLPMDKIHLLEKRADVPKLLRALDVFVLPSISESFPNSLAEAMATGLACVATDVGMCSDVLAMQRFVVPPGNEVRLGKCLADALEMDEQERAAIGEQNRSRIAKQFDLHRMVEQFDALFAGKAI